jgi:signal transduction histidine kinase
MEDALSHEGFLVSVAHDVFSAVSRHAAAPADAAVLSLASMEDRDVDVFRFLRDQHPSLYLVASFPPDRREMAVKALATGADAYLLEPFYLGEFLDLVRRGLGRLPPPEAAPAAAPSRSADGGLDRLSGAVAHAINNPLQIMKLLLPDKPVADAREFQHEIDRIHAVANGLRTFSRRRDFAPRLGCDVNRVVRSGAEDAVPGLAGIEFGSGELPPIESDEAQLRTAFAIYATLAQIRGPRLPMKIGTSQEAAGPVPGIVVRYTVRDLLLSRAEVANHAEPFTSIFAGEVGLDGASAFAIIEVHGGTVDLRSAPGEGAVLTVRLPLRANPPQGEASRAGQEG